MSSKYVLRDSHKTGQLVSLVALQAVLLEW